MPLRELVAFMREVGLTELRNADVTLVLGPAPQPRLTASEETPVDEAKAEADRDERQERELRSQWAAYWRTVTASSGAPIPNYDKDQALSLFGGWS